MQEITLLVSLLSVHDLFEILNHIPYIPFNAVIGGIMYF